jgi:hypothetical protein
LMIGIWKALPLGRRRFVVSTSTLRLLPTREHDFTFRLS